MRKIHAYHIHVYFDEATRSSASALHDKLIETFGSRIRVHRLIDEPIGPHPLPMFETDIPPQEFATVVPWLSLNHGPHSVLIHPLTGHELEEHRDNALWLGKQLTLDLRVLRG